LCQYQTLLIETRISAPLILKPTIGHDTEPVQFTSHPHNLFTHVPYYSYHAISFSVFQMTTPSRFPTKILRAFISPSEPHVKPTGTSLTALSFRY